MDLGTPFGLAFASGLNAYLPLLAFAVQARWLRLYAVNPQFAFITQDWVMIALVILTVLDFVADKIPLIDHAWDATHTFIRPIAGAIVAAASIHAAPFSISTAAVSSSVFGTAFAAASGIPVTGIVLIVALLIGGILAAMSHTAKATTRLVSTFTTAGLFNIGLSIIEDALVIVAILLALFVPVVMLILLVLFLLFFGPRLFRLWSKWMRSRARV